MLARRYIFLLAGHETSSHTLTFLYTLLALYPEHQQKLYEEARAVFDGNTPAYSDYSKLVSLRLRP